MTLLPAICTSNGPQCQGGFYYSSADGTAFGKTHLPLEELLYLCRVGLRISGDINRFGFSLLHPELERALDLAQVRQAHVHGERGRGAAVVAHALWRGHEVRPGCPILQHVTSVFLFKKKKISHFNGNCVRKQIARPQLQTTSPEQLPHTGAVPSPSRSAGESPRRAGAAVSGYTSLLSSPSRQTTPQTSGGAGAPPRLETGPELQVRPVQGAQMVKTYTKTQIETQSDLTSTILHKDCHKGSNGNYKHPEISTIYCSKFTQDEF